jgi:transcriptional regulator with XRE-family HTH domain
MSEALSGGGLQTVREHLGLTTDALARILGVRGEVVRRWESGTDAVPDRAREGVARLTALTCEAVTELVEALQDAPGAAVVVYRTDEELHAARPDVAPLTARWWRHVVARAVLEQPGVRVGTRRELESNRLVRP